MAQAAAQVVLPPWLWIVAGPLLVVGCQCVGANCAIAIRHLLFGAVLRRRITFVSLVPIVGGLAGFAGTLLVPGEVGRMIRPWAWVWLVMDVSIPLILVCLPWLIRGRRPFSRS